MEDVPIVRHVNTGGEPYQRKIYHKNPEPIIIASHVILSIDELGAALEIDSLIVPGKK